MAGSDNVIFNTRERPLSTDQNRHQALMARTIADLFRYAFGSRTFTTGANPTEAPRNVVVGGLTVTPNGNNVDVRAGALMQDSSSLLPVPGTYDSDYRIAINRQAEMVSMPSPAGETFYLLEAQMERVVTLTESRDILDPGSGNFVATLVDKIAERQIAFQVVAGSGGNAPAPSGGDWVPIAVVRRPGGGGGPVAATDVYDVRPMWDATIQDNRDQFDESPAGKRGDRYLRTVSVPGSFSDQIHLSAEAFVKGQRLWFFHDGAFDVTAATYKPASVSLTADTWYYLYLVPWQGLGVVDPRDADQAGKGILVLSDVATAQGECLNASALTLPPPFAVATVPANGAVCVAALRRNYDNTGWVWAESVTRNLVRSAPLGVTQIAAVPASTAQTVDLSGFYPSTARAVRALVRQNGGGGSSNGPVRFAVTPVGAGAPNFPPGEIVPDNCYFFGEYNEQEAFHFHHEHPAPVGSQFDLYLAPIPGPGYANTAPDVQVDVIGWGE